MNFDYLFNARSIAIVGASGHEKTVGNDIVKNLATQGYAGKIYPVNPKINELYNLKVYHDISEITEPIDLVIVAIPAKLVSDIIKVAARKGAKAAIVISAGFKEIGNNDLEENLRDVCRSHNVTLIGPNCLGVINPQNKMNASFAGIMPAIGQVAFLSQSGALCTAVLDYAQSMGLGFSKFISIGNKADVDEIDLIRYLHDDPQTKVIALYAEQLNDAPEMIATLKKLNRGNNPKPVIILKSGRTKAGAGAIASHTGSLSGGDSAYEALFSQAGIIRAETVSELFDFAQVFAKNHLTKIEKVAILTNAGGPGVLTTDAVINNGFKMAELSESTTVTLKEFLPPAANIHNPIDVLGDAVADRYSQALTAIDKDPDVDAVVVLLTPQSMTDVTGTAQAIIDVMGDMEKPVAVSFMGQKSVLEGVEMLQKAGIMTTTFPESATASLAVLDKFTRWTEMETQPVLRFDDVDRNKVREIFIEAKKNNQTSFPEAQALEIFQAYNFPLLPNARALSSEEAVQMAQKLGGKLAMKIVSADILHKSDIGGVMLNIDAQNVAQKYQEMIQIVASKKPEAKLDGVLLMQMAPSDGVEVIMGISKAPGLGTMIMVGLGGIYVEVLKDISFGIAPLTHADALHMIETLKSAKIFAGVRGKLGVDKEKLIECLGRLAQLALDFPEIIELDINPLLALPDGALVLDGRLVIE